jgi:hypothetical protein
MYTDHGGLPFQAMRAQEKYTRLCQKVKETFVNLLSNLILLVNNNPPNGEALCAMHVILKQLANLLIVPSAIGVLLTSLLISTMTNWGFCKFHWITVSWIGTIALLFLGAVWLGPWTSKLVVISSTQGLMALSDPTYRYYRKMVLLFGTAQALALILVVWIKQFKPLGKRKAQ